MNQLPDGWMAIKLAEVCDLNPAKPKSNQIAPDLPVTFVPMAAVDADLGAITNPTIRAYSTVAKGFTSFQENDVIMAKITPCMENGKAAIARGLSNGIGFGSTEFHVFRQSAAVLPEYIFHFIRQKSFRKLAEANMTGSVGQKRVPASFLNEFEIPLPPLAEQHRIVAKLNPLLGKMGACQQRLAKTAMIFKRFRQAVLAAACSGELTVDWRQRLSESQEEKNVDFPASWQRRELSVLCRSITDGDHQAPPKQPDGIPFLVIGNISSGKISFQDTRFVSEEYFSKIKAERKPQLGDVLYTVVGATIGIPVVVHSERPFCFQRHIAILKPKETTATHYLYRLMQSQLVYKQAWGNVTGSAQPTLPLGNLRNIKVPIPPTEEQQEIVRRIEALFKLADQLETGYQKAKTQVDKLQQSILAKAFRGELVPTEAELARREERDYEPASALLERIRSERAEHAQGQKEKARSQPKPTTKRKVSGIMVSNGAEKELK